MITENNNITAILPIRAGSQRIKNKNFKRFHTSSLFEIKLNMLLSIDEIDEVIVTSDSEKALNIADSLGAKTHEREPHFASSECSNSEFFLNFLDITDSKNILYSPCTSPLLRRETYSEFLNCFYNMDSNFDSVATVSEMRKHTWFDGKPLNYSLKSSPNSQDLQPIYSLTYGLNIISREGLEKSGNIVGSNPRFFRLDPIEAVDIDNIEEFEIAEFFYKKYVL